MEHIIKEGLSTNGLICETKMILLSCSLALNSSAFKLTGRPTSNVNLFSGKTIMPRVQTTG